VHLHLLQRAMANAGFYGLRTEWWHFNIVGWQKYLPSEEAKQAAHNFGTRWEGKL
jgi:D-alanyl-D-alanine dipeptidase